MQELVCNLSSDGLKLDIIGLTYIFIIRDSQQYNANGYHSLFFDIILQNYELVELGYILTKVLYTLNANISLYLLLMFLNLHFFILS